MYGKFFKKRSEMKAERETKEKLIASARTEFLEKGYARASLRKICANAGVTTGALYFFFQDKEDLFRAIVEPPLSALVNMLKAHFEEDRQILSKPEAYEHQAGDHDEIAEMFIRHLYQNYDSFLLLLTKSQGTAFENSLDQIVDLMGKQFELSAKQYAKQSSGKPPNSYIVHWMAHMVTDAFIHLLTHIPDEEAAMQQTKIILDFIVKGFTEIISPSNSNP